MEEIWRPVRGFRGRYRVSNFGRVKSCIDGKYVKDPEKIMKQQTHYRGYKIIFLRTNGIKRKYFVHRFVAEAFIKNTHNKPIVNHKDGNRMNNHVSNLEWVNDWENCVDKLQRARRLKQLAEQISKTSEEIDLVANEMIEDAIAKF